MWNRQQVKEQAKLIMKRNYWKMFVVTLLTGILTGEKTTIIERVQDFASNNHSYDAQPIFYSSNFELIFYSFISVASILGILYTIFIGNVIVLETIDILLRTMMKILNLVKSLVVLKVTI